MYLEHDKDLQVRIAQDLKAFEEEEDVLFDTATAEMSLNWNSFIDA